MNDIEKAIDEITVQAPVRQRFINYYDGNHDLAFATEKFRNTFGAMLKNMRENLCQIVVDAPADRMEVINFSSGDTQTQSSQTAWQIWQDASMELLSDGIHKEAFKCGAAFLLVWADIDGAPDFFVQDSRQCALIEDEHTGKSAFGAKLWLTDDNRARLTLYYADRIEKYITGSEYKEGIPLKDDSFIPFEDDFELPVMPNPYNTIPMFYFETDTLLASAIPIQDRLNKTICDELVAQEFSAFRQRYATGLELPVNDVTGNRELPFKAGVDRLWFTDDKDVKFGEFGASDLKQFLAVEDAARYSVARVTGTPLHFFSFTISRTLSGEALKTLESRFTKRIKRTCVSFGRVWADAMKLALAISGLNVTEAITTQWESPEQRSDAELVDTLIKKIQLGVPQEILLQEFGYTNEDLALFKKLNAAEKATEDLTNSANTQKSAAQTDAGNQNQPAA